MAKKDTIKDPGKIRVGIGGWIYPPWRGVFYPKGLKQADELAYAASHLTTIEINATFYRLQKPASFRKWADTAPDGFKFSLKAPRLLTYRTTLAEGGDFMQRFFGSGLTELGDKLGPILWQLPPTKTFDAADFGKFLELLPHDLDGRKLHHVVEVRHENFRDHAFIRLLRDAGVTLVFSESESYPAMADVTGDIIYGRLQKGSDAIETCYPGPDIDAWADRARTFASGAVPNDLPTVDSASKTRKTPRDVYLYFIHEGKSRAPTGAMALIERLA
ncbi:MAG: DUF72 domain-containing protein [Methyloceanibacter sp.]|uniref:DUF72 domain-containing protein n=1 Tax=Methyloceanibacter sp. TaxID=1965321 RepID=UPI003D9B9F57